jgi:hypothetical protein
MIIFRVEKWIDVNFLERAYFFLEIMQVKPSSLSGSSVLSFCLALEGDRFDGFITNINLVVVNMHFVIY